jgi:hypothetical protein
VKSSTAADSTIALTFKKYVQSSLEIVPSQPLPPEEYAFTAIGTEYCYGVDAK